MPTIIGKVVSDSKIMHCPAPDTAWFSSWLLIFNWTHSPVKETHSRLSLLSSSQHINNATFHEDMPSSNDSDHDGVGSNDIKPCAAMIKRWMHGASTCGLGVFGLCFTLSGHP